MAEVPSLAVCYLGTQFFLVDVCDFLRPVRAVLASEELDVQFDDGGERIVVIGERQFCILDGHNLMSPFEDVAACDNRYFSS